MTVHLDRIVRKYDVEITPPADKTSTHEGYADLTTFVFQDETGEHRVDAWWWSDDGVLETVDVPNYDQFARWLQRTEVQSPDDWEDTHEWLYNLVTSHQEETRRNTLWDGV